MSYAPFDGILLDDPRPPVPGAVAMLLHLKILREQMGREVSLDAVKARAQACQELLAHGISVDLLKELEKQGLETDTSRLSDLMAHLEAYLQALSDAGYIEPDEALWRAVDEHLEGRRAFWIERSPMDGLLPAGLRDLSPARLRVLACVPEMSGAVFALATRKGDGSSGLFGGNQPMIDWFMDGLEHHGVDFPNEMRLVEPPGWGSAPWISALERLFEGPLNLKGHTENFRRALVEGPVEMLFHGVEQVMEWIEDGQDAQYITLIHPHPEEAGPLLEALLAAEGVALQTHGGMKSLKEGHIWSPIWSLLQGLLRLDPFEVSAGLRTSRRSDLRQWADLLAQADQDGLLPFETSFVHLTDAVRPGVQATWQALLAFCSASRCPAEEWLDRLEDIVKHVQLAADPDDFFSPFGLIRKSWYGRAFSYREMLTTLCAFLEAARTAGAGNRGADGPKVRLLPPSALLDDWDGGDCTLVLDLSEGAWPARAEPGPDLDWDMKFAINRALVEYTRSQGPVPFPPALQRFWLPRSEHGDQIPRAYQREAYAFNKVLAMTQRELVVLSPEQDSEGRAQAQGPFWNALEGAGTWLLAPAKVSSRLRWRWEGLDGHPLWEARSKAARPLGSRFMEAAAPKEDHVPVARLAWQKGREDVSPTALESLALCPFRSLAERVWRLGTFDAGARLRLATGTLVHLIMEEVLKPYVGFKHWPERFLEDIDGASGMEKGAERVDAIQACLERLWQDHREQWLTRQDNVPREQWAQVAGEVEDLLPNLAMALLLDAEAKTPLKAEKAFLFPHAPKPEKDKKSKEKVEDPLDMGWQRTLLQLEERLAPQALDLGGGRSLQVSGQLDRLERWTHEMGDSFLRITDYKTSGKGRLRAFSADDGLFTKHMQAALYMLMVRGLHGGAITSVFLPLRDEVPEAYGGHLEFLEEGWEERLLASLALLDLRLEAGDFPPTPGDHCRQCEMGALCLRPVDVSADESQDEENVESK